MLTAVDTAYRTLASFLLEACTDDSKSGGKGASCTESTIGAGAGASAGVSSKGKVPLKDLLRLLQSVRAVVSNRCPPTLIVTRPARARFRGGSCVTAAVSPVGAVLMYPAFVL